MTAVLERDRHGCSLLTLSCDGCPRRAVTDTLTAATLREHIGWEHRDGADLCTICLWRQGIAPPIARRYARRSP
jgi:hypothetical protein